MGLDRHTLAFTVPFIEDGKVWTLYIPSPSKERFDYAAPVLGALFSLKETSGLAPIVLARDYEVYAKKVCKQLANDPNRSAKDNEREEQSLFKNFAGFIEASFMSGSAIDPDNKAHTMIEAKKILNEDTLEYATGLYVFFSATYRYAAMIIGEKGKEELSTFLSLMEYMTRSQTSSSVEDPIVPKVEQ